MTNDPSDDVVIATLPATFIGTGDPNDNDNNATKAIADSGTSGNDTGNGELNGTVNNDVISGGDGNDEIYGGAGNDTLNGDAGADKLFGGTGSDTLNGGVGTDPQLYGGSGTDTITGGDGSDTIIGGYGADILNGNNGNDKFVYLDVKDTNDTINGFASGSDQIDLTAIDANSSLANNQAFAWGDHQTGQYVQAHSVTWFTNGVDVVVLADTDGNLQRRSSASR